MDSLHKPSRRAFVRAAGALAAAGASGRLWAAPTKDVVVLTAYPDAVVSRFEAAFEKAWPQYRLRIVWRMPHDALPYLRQAGQGGVDVYWSASPKTYAQLKDEHAFRKLPVSLEGLPGRVGGSVINDPDGFYAASEVAGYGFAVNPAYLHSHKLPPVADWSDLADPVYADHLAVPDPVEVGFAPVLVDIPLQAYGWDIGWALWSAIAANAAFTGRGGTFVSDEIGGGRKGIGLSIDFFVASAVANGAPVEFIYPRQGGVNPAHIAVTAGSPNPDGAKAFVDFVLSDAGQKILAHPDIRKLPVRPSVYAGLPAGYHDPFATAARGGYLYDNGRGRGRAAPIAAAFGQAFVRPHARLVELWRRLHAADGAAWNTVWPLLTAPPLKEAEADDPAIQRAFFARRDDPAAEVLAAGLEKTWASRVDARYAKAASLLGVA
ncbi:MAG: extracellular solute-binding protein [Proteobacteria bacterium]|nr:extracellular solute-binding protein [Pseudomonadota bacterium]